MSKLSLRPLALAPLCLALISAPLLAQEEELNPELAEVAAKAEAEAQAEIDKNSNDPSDEVARHLRALSDIVSQNADQPERVLERFEAYLKQNDKAMRSASKAFETKLRRMRSNDAEAYRASTQRKISPILEQLMVDLIQFSNKYPESAQKLDSLLKVDARYSYQP